MPNILSRLCFWRKPESKPAPDPPVLLNVDGMMNANRIIFEIEAVAEEPTPGAQSFLLAQGVKSKNCKLYPCHLIYTNDQIQHKVERGTVVRAHLVCMIVESAIVVPPANQTKRHR